MNLVRIALSTTIFILGFGACGRAALVKQQQQSLLPLYNAIYTVCANISEEISDLHNTTVANTVVSGVGTVAAGGALYAGLTKQQIDKEIERLQQQICSAGGCDEESVARMSDEDFFDNIITPMSHILELQEQLENATKKSIRAGNWRTGLMAVATTTNITSAVLAGINLDQSDLIQQITACNNAINLVKRANISELDPDENPIITKLNQIQNQCKTISPENIKRIEQFQRAVMGSSIAGATTGLAGTITSATANSARIRADQTEQGRTKEKNLNTAANLMAGTTTALGAVSTIVNMATLAQINEIINQAKLCEQAL